MKKSILVLSAVLAACVFMGCKKDIESDDVKSPIKLQLKDSDEYVEADWEYPITNEDSKDSEDGWKICETGKDCLLILNYNPRNGYYLICDKNGTDKYNKEMFRSYTVDELEKLIGVEK